MWVGVLTFIDFAGILLKTKNELPAWRVAFQNFDFWQILSISLVIVEYLRAYQLLIGIARLLISAK